MGKTTEELQTLSFQIILHAGNARSTAMEALKLAKTDKFQEAWNKLNEADVEFTKAHKIQTNLLQNEAKGEKNELSLILVHAQDHLMTAMTVRDLANEMIDMYATFHQKGETNA